MDPFGVAALGIFIVIGVVMAFGDDWVKKWKSRKRNG